jgi:hypothetical protein
MAAQTRSKGRIRPRRPYRATRLIGLPWRKRSGHLLAPERPQRPFAIYTRALRLDPPAQAK